ncbi:MAG: hypothetical protein M0R06_03110 [Sphaerochaeta sp.]|nr:hypothetical protein [Sphaerochaeta sp.]
MKTKTRVTAISERVSFVELDIERLREDIREMVNKIYELASLGCEKTEIIKHISKRVNAMAKKLNVTFNEFDEVVAKKKKKRAR